jgi:aryl-alcohol dehydrogenase-like predicted oxidoreductase
MRKQVVDPALASSFPRVQGETLQKNLATVEFLEHMAATKGRTPAQLAIAWMLSRGDDIVALLGMSRRSHLIENLGAFDVSFSPEDLAALDKVFAPGAIIGSRS